MAPANDADPSDLLKRHSAQIGRLVRRLVAPDDADDLEQELHVAALERPPRNRVALPSWIATTLRNLVAKRWRGRARREAREAAAARPEPLPSTDQLVARVELEEFLLRCVRELPEPERVAVLLRFFEGRSAAEIAAQLGLGVSSVRARLARALTRLRERLDQKSGGDRGQWVAALTPWFERGTAAAAAGATAATVVGVFSMGWKLTAAAVVLALAAGAWWSVETLPRATKRVEISGQARHEAAPSPSTPAPNLAAPAAAERVVETPAAAPAATNVKVEETGRLKLRIVDAATLQRIDGPAVRGLSATRFFTRVWSLETGDLPLAPDSYEVGVSAAGYERALLGSVVVARDQTTDLGTIALVRGSGSILGRVLSRALPPEARRYVELRGDGRRPCPRCGQPGDPATALDRDSDATAPATTLEGAEALLRRHYEQQVVESPCCGYFADRSFVRVGPDGTFEFDGLAEGVYFLRALDALPRLQATLHIELACGERRSVDLSLEPQVTLELELRDEVGQRFVGLWKSDAGEETEPIHFDVEIDGVAFGIAAAPERDDVRARLGPPPCCAREPAEGEGPSFVSARSASTRANFYGAIEASLKLEVDDARAPGEWLFPAPPTPAFASVEMGVVRVSASRYVLTRLPATKVKVSATCAGVAAAAREVDLADPQQRRATMVFVSKQVPQPAEEKDEAERRSVDR
jgi:RNA polymerase sigma factor (sigma-70 family)